jgi:D-tyrosyl-tRNA(Tyr) deacylase
VRAVVERVAHASVRVDGNLVGAIDRGLLVFLGIAPDDDEPTARKLALKVANLRIFEDGEGRMNLAIAEAAGSVLAISQFTLYGDLRKGNRPSFTAAAAPDVARTLYEAFCDAIETAGLRCERGVFGAHMAVELLNDGPVTLVLDSADLDRPRRA